MSEGPFHVHAPERRLAGLMKLVEVTCELAALHDLDGILASVTKGVCAAIDCERASLFLYNERQRELYTRVVTQLEIEEIRSSVETGITGWVARNQAVANVPDPAADARWNSSFDQKTGYRTRNILAAPVLSPRDGRMVGVMQLLNRREGPFDDFDEQVVRAFAAHAANALERALLLEEARRSQEMRLAIEMGRQIQASFLPRSLPQIPGYELAVWWEPAESVSGDYYDLLSLPDGRLGLVMADVSGHGVGPSLIMAAARAMLRVLARGESEPHRILTRLSETIHPDLPDSRFITFLLVALDPRSHELSFANAGHGPALHFQSRTREFRPLEATGLPLGVLDEAIYAPGDPCRLAAGDLLILATDGAIELRNEKNEMFGIDRLQRLAAEHSQLSAPDLLATLRTAISSFHPEPQPADDITLLILKRQGAPV